MEGTGPLFMVDVTDDADDDARCLCGWLDLLCLTSHSGNVRGCHAVLLPHNQRYF
jgi:hypothetical protein